MGCLGTSLIIFGVFILFSDLITGCVMIIAGAACIGVKKK